MVFAPEFADKDLISFLEHGNICVVYVAKDADGKARAGEWMPFEDERINTQCSTHMPHFILKKHAQGLHDFQVHFLGETAYVVMRFDGRRRTFYTYAFNHVGINGALREPFDVIELFRLLVEHFNKNTTNGFAFFLRVADAFECIEELPARINANDVKTHVAVSMQYLAEFIFAQKPVVYKNAGELVSNGILEQ